MVNISIAKDVYEFIQNNAIIFVDKTPNDTLRRLFRLQGKNSTKTIPYSTLRRKAPRTDLLKLKVAGLIVDGQLVTMRDHKGNYIPGAKAIIKGKGVVYNGNQYSLSEITRIILNEIGYTGSQYRGPAFWYTKDNISIMELWMQYLKQ